MKKNYIYNLLLTVFNILFPILSFPYISRILGPVGVGKVQFVLTFAQYFALVAALGIPYYGVREIAKARYDQENLSRKFSELSIIYIITSLILSIIYVAVIFSFDKFSTDYKFYLASSLVVLFGFSAIDWFYQGLEEFKSIAIRSVIIKLLSLVLMYVFVKNGNDAIIYLWVSIFAILGNNVINIIMLKGKVSFTFKNLQFHAHTKPLLYIFGTNLSTAMYNMLDTILLGLLSNNKAVGYYTASVKISRITIPLVVSMGLVLLPKITQSFLSDDGKYKEYLLSSYNFIIVVSIPICFGMLFLAPEMIHLVSGPQFAPAILPMQILAFLPLLIGIGNLLGVQVLIAAGREKEMLKSVMIGMAVSLVLNVILVPKMQEVGAAIANVVTEMIVSFMFYHYMRKSYDISFKLSTFFRSVIACSLFFPVIYLFRHYVSNEVFILGLSVASCATIYYCVEYFILRDEYIRDMTFKAKGMIYKKFGNNTIK